MSDLWPQLDAIKHALLAASTQSWTKPLLSILINFTLFKLNAVLIMFASIAAAAMMWEQSIKIEPETPQRIDISYQRAGLLRKVVSVSQRCKLIRFEIQPELNYK